MRTIDLNADVGEGCGQDDKLLKIVSSANVCTGLHAGSPIVLAKTLALAKENGVTVGAHPSYDDRANFGRLNQNLSKAELVALLTYQLGTIQALCVQSGVTLRYVKPHGALYNQAATDSTLARVLAETIASFNERLAIMGLAGSALITAGREYGLATISEAFADRRYNADGTLVARGVAGAVIDDAKQALSQVKQMIEAGTVTAITGETVTLQADSICLHGDNDHAVQFATNIYKTLLAEGFVIAAKGV